MTKHNGRAGKNGVYNPKHNDRSFDVDHSEHIDGERAEHNIYWDCYNGFRQIAEKESDDMELSSTFEEVEQFFYQSQYSDYTDAQNKRNEKTRHTERNRSPSDLLKNRKTCPEESILQIGKKEEHVSPETLFIIATEFFTEFDERFGSRIHILDWALHIDESTPHIHERHVFDCENKYGEVCPQQEKALEALGFELLEPDKKQGRHNNRKMVFDATCRTLLFDICKRHGLQLEEEPEYGGREYLEKQDFILKKQKEELEKQSKQIQKQENWIQNQKLSIQSQNDVLYEQHQILKSQRDQIGKQDADIQKKEDKLDELNFKIEDMETLLDEVTDVAYDKAVEVVTDSVRAETQKEDLEIIDQYHKSVTSSGAKNTPQVVNIANLLLGRLKEKLKESSEQIFTKVQNVLMKPEVKKANTQQIKEKTRGSVLEKLHQKQSKIDRQKNNQTHKKHNMEL